MGKRMQRREFFRTSAAAGLRSVALSLADVFAIVDARGLRQYNPRNNESLASGAT